MASLIKDSKHVIDNIIGFATIPQITWTSEHDAGIFSPHSE